MNFKKIAASLTALVCCTGAVQAFPQLMDNTYAAEVVNNDFEVNYDGWHGSTVDVTLTAESGEGADSSRGMTVSDRTSPEDGASSSKGFYLWGGTEYKYSVQVFSETDETFHLSLLCIDEETGKETVKELASEKVKAGQWTELSAKYTAPENSYEFQLTITTDSTNDFTFDNVVITEKKSKNEANAAVAGKGLKDEFANYFRVGNILNGGTVKNSAITATMLKDHNAIECENETKPDATIVQNGSTNTNVKVSLNNCAAIVDFCVNNNIAFRGHTLVWHSQTPEWFFKENFDNNGAYVNTTVMDQRMESYIKNMFGAFASQYPTLNLYSYDVCNEVIYDGTASTTGYRPTSGNGRSAWVQVYGNNSFVEKAFTYARKYAPEGCKLYYNDYNEFAYDKQNCIINTILKPLSQKGLLDGMGMQSHISAAASNAWGDTTSYLAAMDKYLDLGIDVQVTELDISTDGGTYTLQQQADKYKAIFQHCVDVNKSGKYKGSVTLVQVWGPNDANSWVGTNSNGQSNAPLLYDRNNQPKLAYNTLINLLPDSEWGDGNNPVGGEVTPIEPNEYGWYFNDPFEGDLCSWESRGATTLLTSGRTAYVGNEALLISERTAAWNGAYKSLNPRAFVPGNEYSFSVNVNYFDGPATDTFCMKLEYTDGNGDTQYSTIAQGNVNKGEWAQLANKNYLIPVDATNMKLYVETTETTNNFYIDEAIGAVAGTSIIGAGEAKTVMLGDINFDGTIDCFDIIAARNGLANGGFNDSLTTRAADVDQSGKFDVADVVNLQSFVIRRISEFPVAEKVIDTAAMEQLFSTVKVASSYKKDGENNVLWTQRFGADPGFMVYKDRLYVYTTNDAFEYDSNGNMQENTYNVQTINCFSSADLVNWTDHGAIPVAGSNGAAKNWAHFSWAPDACWKTINGKDKFFLYFADSAGGIGVLTADSPTGPWTDPLGHALINKSTPGYGNVTWLFDPAVLVDDDGTGYLYCGGGVPDGKAADPGTARAVKLGDDMISLSGSCVTINPPYLFEDSSIFKSGDTYYYSYCTNWSTGGNPYGFNNAEIGVMTSKSPLGPFTYQGIALKNPASYQLDGGGNNHHSLLEFKGKYYVLYHSRVIERRMGVNNGNGYNYRSCHIDEATLSNGMITASGSMKGVSQIESLNPYTTVQAETMSNQSSDIVVNGLSDTTVSMKKGSWTKVSGVDLSKGANTLKIRASSSSGAVVKVCKGSATGEAITYAEIPAGGSMSDISVPVIGSVSGNTDLYFVFSGNAEFDSWSIS